MKHRVLFVDDEPMVLEGIENLLFDRADELDLYFATSGAEALAKLGREGIDVIVSDMQMPGMSGEELLSEVQRRAPDVVRIVLTGHTEREAAERTIPIAHDFLSKPCEADVLVDSVTRAVALQRSFPNPSVRALIGGLNSLPPRPSTYARLCDLLRSDHTTMREVGAFLKSDLAISTQLLHVANSAVFSRGRSVRTVEEAASRLGLRTVRALVLGLEAFNSFDVGAVLDIDELHSHSEDIANLCARAFTNPDQIAEGYLAGMLHDIGKLVIASRFPEEYRKMRTQPVHLDQPASLLERQALGFTHSEVGAYLLRLWKVDSSVADAAALHSHSDAGSSRSGQLACAIHAAHLFRAGGEPTSDACAEALSRMSKV